jgi:hypothetical protein
MTDNDADVDYVELAPKRAKTTHVRQGDSEGSVTASKKTAFRFNYMRDISAVNSPR